MVRPPPPDMTRPRSAATARQYGGREGHSRLSRACRAPVARLSPACRAPVARLSRACRPPVARLSRACRPPVARLSRACRAPVARLSPACRAPVARLSPARRAPVDCMANTFILALLVMAALSVRMLHVSVPSRELDGKLSYVER